jgi:hypothetical protein
LQQRRGTLSKAKIGMNPSDRTVRILGTEIEGQPAQKSRHHSSIKCVILCTDSVQQEAQKSRRCHTALNEVLGGRTVQIFQLSGLRNRGSCWVQFFVEFGHEFQGDKFVINAELILLYI